MHGICDVGIGLDNTQVEEQWMTTSDPLSWTQSTTIPFDKGAYGKLLMEVLPKPITCDEELDKVLPIVEHLFFNKVKTPEQAALCNLLVILVTTYESEVYPVETYPFEMLRDTLESSGTTLEDLSTILGITTVEACNIVDGTVGISKGQAEALGKHFKVSHRLFI